ncbi:MAG: MBL fold metallo-hydrolase [Armatimonadetes bacterium]|nr:MBL fold metallo-hydrolase [Armatimonadota bacterium]
MRTRCSCLIEVSGKSILIDTPPELRIQLLRENVRHIDSLLFTHAHADHIFGLDDIRRFNELSGTSIPIYGNSETLITLRKTFEYVFVPTQLGGGKPMLDLIEVGGPFEASGVPVIPVPIYHGGIKILGYRIGDFAYVTDCSRIAEHSMDMLRGLHTLVLGVIRHEPHETHFTISQGVCLIEKLKPCYAFFTHITHKLDHEKTNAALPNGVQLAYDGLQLEIN